MQLQARLPHGTTVAAVPLFDLAYLTAMLGDDGVDVQFVHESSLSVTRPDEGRRGNTREGTDPRRSRRARVRGQRAKRRG